MSSFQSGENENSDRLLAQTGSLTAVSCPSETGCPSVTALNQELFLSCLEVVKGGRLMVYQAADCISSQLSPLSLEKKC